MTTHPPLRGPPSLAREGFPGKPPSFYIRKFHIALWYVREVRPLYEPSHVLRKRREGGAEGDG